MNKIIQIRYQRLPRTKQPFLYFIETTSFNPYIVSSRNLTRCVSQHGDSENLKSSHSHIKNDHELNSRLEIIKTTSSKRYVLLIGWIRPKKT